MKKHSAIFFILISIVFNSCIDTIVGSNNVITEKRNVNNFTTVLTELSGNINIFVCKDSAYSCNIVGQDNVLPNIITETNAKDLIIRYKPNVRFSNIKETQINLVVPTLAAIKLLGSGNVNINGVAMEKELLCALMGSGNIVLNNIKTEKLKVELAGSGNITLNNTQAILAEYALKGSGNIYAQKAIADSVRAIIHGSGDIECNVNSGIEATNKGSGTLSFYGNPINKKIVEEGIGKIIQVK